jgi:hypothetical protein
MKMMIKFSDATIKAAHTMWFKEGWNIVNGVQADWRAAAAVFEVAANAQVIGGAPIGPNGPIHAAPEPFQVGKRYRTRGGDIAEICRVNESGDYPVIGTIGVEKYSWGLSGALYVNSLRPHEFDLIPGSIPDAPAESVVGMTDEGLAGVLFDAYAQSANETEGWLAVARRARELLQPCNGMMQASDDGKTVTPLCEFRARAERAEAAIERARAKIENVLRIPSNTDRGDGIDFALKDIAHILGFKITPVRELTVTWDQNTDSESDEITSEIDPLFSEEEYE